MQSVFRALNFTHRVSRHRLHQSHRSAHQADITGHKTTLRQVRRLAPSAGHDFRANTARIARRDGDGPGHLAREDGRSLAEIEAARREVSELKERVKVLERIATDANSSDAREQARIAAEIEALRGLPAASKEEPDQ